MPDLQDQYEQEHLRSVRNTERRIRQAFESAILEVTPLASTITAADGTVFQLADYPGLSNRISRIIQRLHASVYATTINGINLGWDLSSEKNDILVDRRLAGRKPSEAAKQILFDANDGARRAFVERTDNGLNLSDRVWNTLDNFRTEMEAALGLGVSEGKSATAMASDLRKYLNEPDRLFRRVRDHQGRLQLSEAARNYKPGRGVYRSSYKNALRVARTEQNMAYRTADHVRWQQIPFVTGIEIRLSNNHPVYDICDELKGKYPKEFKWSGWHPQCLCHAVAVQMSDAEYDKYEDSILGLGEAPEVKKIETPPAGLGEWLEKNRERVKGWGSEPYWMQDNPQYVE
ncbi:hypothetical protein SAMN05444008_102382 [Cnuella takakiae]|uniref:Phage Mu protein F like protein n=1 Tax=Cnuella takakiae TaxID=1302690 RepID=A0A1M4VUE7_9BACT|nr:hypothetical protein [Cnuella takakiae]OLY92498.1 hypothetical protein BUE76_11820 [Cnuella takakiae]SHE72432.1 hypothetical protein SAMN05444008_102382 [Cnuella takakiae]